MTPEETRQWMRDVRVAMERSLPDKVSNKHAVLAVAAAFATYADDTGAGIEVAASTVAEQCMVSRETVGRIRAWLYAAGLAAKDSEARVGVKGQGWHVVLSLAEEAVPSGPSCGPASGPPCGPGTQGQDHDLEVDVEEVVPPTPDDDIDAGDLTPEEVAIDDALLGLSRIVSDVGATRADLTSAEVRALRDMVMSIPEEYRFDVTVAASMWGAPPTRPRSVYAVVMKRIQKSYADVAGAEAHRG